MEEIIAVADAPPPPLLPSGMPPVLGRERIEHPFEFHGDAREYFRIWIVNLALSIVTLGIFSAWAKVRTQRYFYGNTRLAGVPFEYLAKPWPILKGRLIAVVLFGGYVLAGQFSLKLQLGAAAVIGLLTPWLLVRGLAFRARYSSWRGINFRFVPDYGEAYIRYLLLGLPVLLTLGLMYPYVKARQKAFFVEHHRYGGSWFSFRATPAQFYPPYLIAWGAIFAWMFVASITAGMLIFSSIGAGTGAPPVWVVYVYVIPLYLGYFVVWAFLAATLANLVYNHSDLGRHRFRSTLKGHSLLWIYAGNTVAILASAGLLIPWAKVRLARYRAQTFTVLAGGDLSDFRAESRTDVGAAAAEMDGLFDIDIGL